MRMHVALRVLAVGLVGCGGTAETQKVAPPTSATQTETQSVEKAAETKANDAGAEVATEVTLRTSSFDELQATIAKHKGKVVVCDFWSTSCEPCVREFPHLVALSQKFPAEKLVCISASLDFDGLNKLDDYKGPVLEFLKAKQATIDNVLFTEEDTVIYEKLKIASIPAVFVYAADGSRAKVFDESSGKEFTYEKDINPFVAELVAAVK